MMWRRVDKVRVGDRVERGRSCKGRGLCGEGSMK